MKNFTSPPVHRSLVDILVLCLFLLSSSSTALAQSATAQEAPAPRRIGFMTEQDAVLGDWNKDQNYTMGLGIYFPQNDLGKVILKGINLLRKDGEKYEFIQNTMGIANSTFTPEYLGNNKIDSLYYMINDRPFAAINYLSTVLSYTNDDTGNSFSTFGFNLGIIGTDFSQWAQSYIHKNHWFGSERAVPIGWANQISESKPAPTFLVYLRKSKLLIGQMTSEDDENNRGYFQVSHSYEGKLGYYVGGSYSLNMRLGFLDKKNWANDFFPLGVAGTIPAIADGGAPSIEKEIASNAVKSVFKASREVFLLGNVKPNVWLYNAFLLGQFNKNDFHTLEWNQMNKVTVDFNVGIGGQLRVYRNQAISGALTLSVRTPEFKTTEEFTRWHKWAGVQIYYVY